MLVQCFEDIKVYDYWPVTVLNQYKNGTNFYWNECGNHSKLYHAILLLQQH